MRGFELLEKMGLIDPKYIEAADKTPVRHVNIWLKLGAVAACVAIIVAAFLKLPPREIPQVNPTLPTLNHSVNVNGYGYEGYSAYDISQIFNCNPWYDTSKLKTLPVYDNPLSSNGAGEAWGADIADLKTFALDVATRLGIESPAIQCTDYNGKPVPDDNTGPTMVIIETEDIRIEVDQEFLATVLFYDPIPIPEGYNLAEDATYEETLAIAEYLKVAHSDLIGMDDPQINITGQYNLLGEARYYFNFFNGSNDLSEEIINYNFNTVTISYGENVRIPDRDMYADGIWLMRIWQPDLSHKVADYPIISASEAQKLLIDGHYGTDCGYEFPGKKYISKVELLYRNSVFDDYYMPYYRFYVELPQEKRDDGLKSYATFYVPAVESSYIVNMPTYNGHVN